MGKYGKHKIPRNILCLDENDLIGKEMKNVVEMYKDNFEEAINLLKPDLDEFYKKSLFERADIFFQFNEYLKRYENTMRKNVRRQSFTVGDINAIVFLKFIKNVFINDECFKKMFDILYKDIDIIDWHERCKTGFFLKCAIYFWLYEKVEENIANENLSAEKLQECYDYYVTQCYKRDEEEIEKEMRENEKAIEDDDDDDIEDDDIEDDE